MPFDDDFVFSSNVVTRAYDETLSAIRNSSSKNDCIRNLRNIKVGEYEIGSRCAHKIYNKYCEYNGNVKKRRKKIEK